MATLRKIITEFVFNGDTKKVQQVEKSIENIKKGAKGASSTVNTLKKSFQGLNPVIRDSLKIMAGFFTARAIFNLGKSIIRSTLEMEKFTDTFEILLKDITLAKSLLKDIGDFSAQAGIEFSKTVKISTQLLARRIGPERIIDTIKTLTILSKGLGTPIEQIARALLDVKTKGKLAGEEVRQFANANIGIVSELSDMLGKNTDVISDMISKGKIGFKEVEEALKRMTVEGGLFFGILEKMSKRLPTSIKKLRNEIFLLGVELGKIVVPTIKLVVDGLTSLFKGIRLILPWIKILAIGGIAVLGLKVLSFISILNQLNIAIIGSFLIMRTHITAMKLLWSGLFVVIGLVVDDIIAFFQGRNSVTQIVVDGVNKMLNPLRKLDDMLTSIGDKLREKFPFLKKFAEFNEKRRQKTLEAIDEIRGTTFSEKFKGLKLAPKLSRRGPSINNSSAVIQSPKITVNIDNAKTDGKTLIKDVSQGIENGLKNILNQSLRVLTQ